MPFPDWWWTAWYANPDRRKEMIRDHLVGPLVAAVVLVPILLAALWVGVWLLTLRAARSALPAPAPRPEATAVVVVQVPDHAEGKERFERKTTDVLEGDPRVTFPASIEFRYVAFREKRVLEAMRPRHEGNLFCEVRIPTTPMNEHYLSEDTRLYAERLSDELFGGVPEPGASIMDGPFSIQSSIGRGPGPGTAPDRGAGP